MPDDAPENMADAIASGLGLAALRTLIDRHGGDYDDAPGVPRDEFTEGREELVEAALRKGVIYATSDGRLHTTDDERLDDADDYEDARAAARRTAEDRGHEVVEP